ncbi:NACHT domain-containing protein [Advenella mimigardefordensis]|uniref:Uncharacterized protein n=1 Tax=Advenella mimigardefordensis (strain DSM 17166 / LMG 22922 / DPN7) TaxID=1247726 RepID=W0P7P7_ADVMD|nr:hypothetical protein [Advenella mimigardefordensis]AHG62874.1 hypothetical protein MIM_c07750 [Advenella mimigardefordensis DPN7]
MKDKFVPLERHFSLIRKSESDQDDQEVGWVGLEPNPITWEDLKQEFRCVILAEAGAGKSFEMEAQANLTKKRGQVAFFIRIEDIEDDFENAFEVGSATAFESWLGSKEDAWFFLDSVDEARLEAPHNFEKAIKRFARRIKPAYQRAHIFISSRPYAWRARSDRELLERYIPYIKPTVEEVEKDRILEKVDDGQKNESQSALQVYLLDPLDESGIRLFAEHRGTPEIDKLIADLQRANLIAMAARPFDLEGILAKWALDQTLDGKYGLIQHNIDCWLDEIDPNRALRQPINREKARRGARLLAAAVVLTGEPGICVPDSVQPNKGIDAKTVLGDWEPTDVQALLERGIFNDALYGIVRFRHREVRDLLAAEWFCEQLKTGGSRNTIESWFLREQYGHLVVTPRLRPILPWLILLDGELQEKVLKMSPEIAVEGGDAAYLPVAVRKSILTDIVNRIANGDDERSVRDNSAIARIAQPDLSNDVLQLLLKYRNCDDAIFFLGRLVWQGEMRECVPTLIGIAIDHKRGIYARVAAIRAIMTCGEDIDIDNMMVELKRSVDAFPRQVLAEVLNNATPHMNSVKFLIEKIDKMEPYKRFESTGLSHALHGFIDRLTVDDSIAGPQPLETIVSGLNIFLCQTPHIGRGESHVSKKFLWLLGPAVHAVERLVSMRSEFALSSEALRIMLMVPAARFWQVEAFDEYKSNLYKAVPDWKRLNDALFWQSIEEARISRLEKNKFERLINVCSVQMLGHFWNFGIDRFWDVLGFVANRGFLDDKLVALSLAHRIYMLAEEPDDWLLELKRTVDGCANLSDFLEQILSPTTHPSILEFEEQEAIREEIRRNKKQELELSRKKWVKRLKAAPDIVRHPLTMKEGAISKDQYCLLREIDDSTIKTSRSGTANWRALIPEFGEEVALAYRDAAVSFWRNYTPGLGSDGDNIRSVPYALTFAMSGLEIEANEDDRFPANLIEADIRHALRYIVWELNGFPRWLEHLHRAAPTLVIEAICTEMEWELANSEPDQPMHYILHDLVYYAPWVHQHLIFPIFTWLGVNEIRNLSVLSHCIHILQSADVDGNTVLKLAKSKIAHPAPKNQLAIWYALWVDREPESGIFAVEEWLSSLKKEEASLEAQLFITELMGTGRSFNSRPYSGNFRNVKDLKALYILMHRFIPAISDVQRAGTGVYSPGLRDNAQDGRNALFNLLSEIPGKETYVALKQLEKDHPDVEYRSWMRKRAYKRAEQDADIEPWSIQQIRDYGQSQISTPLTHRQLFELSVSRLNDLKLWIEQGNDSPYKTWQRVEGETEMRNLVAGWLNGQSLGRYTCAQENEMPNKQRPDIWVQNPNVSSPVPIELKLLDKSWTGPSLCERLRNQLAGDYLREETAGRGVMLLIWQGKSKALRWKIENRFVTLSDLKDSLKSYWDSVAHDFSGVVAIEVILIDLTVRDKKSTG